MNIAICFSPEWIDYVLVELFAIAKTNIKPLTVYLVSDEMTAAIYMKLYNFSRMFYGNANYGKFGNGMMYQWIDARPMYAQYIPSQVNVDTRFTKYTLYRLLLPKIIQDNRLLYLDADTIVNTSLIELYYKFIGGEYLVAGVSDTGILDSQKAAIGLTSDEVYINGGVLLLDLMGIRKAGLDQQWIELVNQQWFGCHDQDIINMTCRGKIKTVGVEWNVSRSTGLQDGQDIISEDIKIMHYAGNADMKPWANPRDHLFKISGAGSRDLSHFEIWDRWAKEYKEAMEAAG